jgi:hypothetical protein
MRGVITFTNTARKSTCTVIWLSSISAIATAFGLVWMTLPVLIAP